MKTDILRIRITISSSVVAYFVGGRKGYEVVCLIFFYMLK